MLSQLLGVLVRIDALVGWLLARLTTSDMRRMNRMTQKRLSWLLLWRASLCQQPIAGEQHVMSAYWCSR